MGEHIGPYEIRGELGRGAMAVVWRAWDPKLEREVAIKEPVFPHGIDAGLREELSARFVREGKTAGQLNHPGIVTIFAADVFDGRPAIVMEIIEGQTLADVLDRGPLRPQSAVAVLDQLLAAVSVAHSRGIVHRDLKPDNIFITHDGRVKLADFGIARAGSTATLTQAGTVMGTPGYMAPEQVTGAYADERADIFSIGVIGYEMLVGRNPFGATEDTLPFSVMYRIVNEEPPMADLSVFGRDLAEVIATAIAKDPADRHPSAEAFRGSLRSGPEHPNPLALAPPPVDTTEDASRGRDPLDPAARASLPTEMTPSSDARAPSKTVLESPAIDEEPVERPASRATLGVAAGILVVAALALWMTSNVSKGGDLPLTPGEGTTTAGELESATTATRDMTTTTPEPAAVTLALSVSDMSVVPGRSATFKTTATLPGRRIPRIQISLQRSYDNKTWTTVARAQTSGGVASQPVRLQKTAYFRAVFAGTTGYSDAKSRVIRVKSVAPPPSPKPKTTPWPKPYEPAAPKG